jgi:hypothetical protein
MVARKLVIGQLEKVSGTLFEQYPAAIKSLIRGKSGVYALYKNDALYYVGLASNLMGRLKAHLRDRHNGKWNRFSVYLTVHDDHMKELESLLLRITRPRGNLQGGKFMASANLRRDLAKLIREQDDDRRASLLGGGVRRRRVRAKAKKTKGGRALSGAFDTGKQLRGWYKDQEYIATLRRDGKIRLGGQLYESPSAAGKAARGRGTNGWTFWHYKDARSGDWVRLNKLKK